jgi:hypothetical protein
VTPFRIVAIEPGTAPSGLYEEVEALARFWRRRAYYSFTSADAPNGESDYSIDLEHLAFALGKVRYYTELLSSRDSKVQTLEVTTERRRDRSEDSTETERRGRE